MNDIVAYVFGGIGVIGTAFTLIREWRYLFRGKFSWKDIIKGVHKLIIKMKKEQYDPDLIIGIGRSGAIIGGLIAGHWGGKHLMVLDTVHDGIEISGAITTSLIIEEEILIPRKYKTILIVKGGSKNGNSFRLVYEFFRRKFPERELCFAAVVKARSADFVKYFAYEVPMIKDNSLPWHRDAPEWPTYL